MTQTVLIKRSIEKDGLPKTSDPYLTDIGEVFFASSTKAFQCSKGEYPLYWYEELPLSQLIEEVMPTEEGMVETYYLFRQNNNMKDAFGLLHKWLKTKLTITP